MRTPKFVRGLAVTVTALTAAATLAGCGTSQVNVSGGLDIAYLGYFAEDVESMGAIADGARSFVEPTHGTVTYFNAEFDAKKQLAQCKKAVSGGKFEAILLSPFDPQAGLACVETARNAGIPVATVDYVLGPDKESLIPQVDGVVAVAASPMETFLEVENQMLLSVCGAINPCTVIAERVDDTEEYSNTILNTIQKHFGNKIQFVRLNTGMEPATLAAELPAALAAHPEATVVLSFSDAGAIAAAPVLASTGNSAIKILGSGGSKAGAQAVADGTIYATTGSWPRQAGAWLAKVLNAAAHGQPVKSPSLDMLQIDSPALITSSTVATFRPEWNPSSSY